MNYTRGGKETLDGIVRVWRRQLRVVASRYSPLQASLFCFGTVVINGSAFRFIVHFRRDWFSRHRFCCGLTLCANTPATIARVFVANYWCLFLEPSIYIYIYIYTSPVSSAKTVSTVPTHFTYHRLPLSPVFQTFTTSRVIGRDVICIRVVATVFSTFSVFFSMYRFSFFPLFFFFSFYLKTSKTQFG